MKFQQQQRRLLASCLVAAAFAGCATSQDDQRPDLDVAMNDGKPAIQTGAGAVPASAVFNWQSFFKAPPTSAEKRIIEQRLDAWKEDKTPAELVAKGRAELAVGRVVTAEASFRRALRLDDTNLDAQLELASMYLRKRDLPRTFELLTQVKDGLGTSSSVAPSFVFRYRYTLALAYIARGDRDRGHKVLSDLIAAEKAFAPAYQALASSYLALERDSVAEFVIRRGLDRSKDDASLLNLMGVIFQRRGEHESARGWFDKALAAQGTFAPARVNRANSAIRAMEYGAAEEDLKQALLHDPTNVDAYVALGIVMRRQGNVPAAREAFIKAVELAPESAHARFNLAVLMADDLKKRTEALRLFQEVLHTSDPAPELRDLASSYVRDLSSSPAMH